MLQKRTVTTFIGLILFAIIVRTPMEMHSQQPTRVRIWIKSFIPKVNPVDPAYVKQVPGSTNRWMIPGPTAAHHCFLTDHRDFSADGSASARVTTDFILVVTAGQAKIDIPVPNAKIHTAGISTQVECATGKVLGQKPGVFSSLHSIGSKPPDMAIGNPAVGGSQVQVIFGVAVSNPFAPPGVSPAIDYSLDTTYDTATKNLTFAATLGEFPAYEGYAQLNAGPAVTMFRAAPTAKTAWGLYDFGTGLATRTVKGTVQLK